MLPYGPKDLANAFLVVRNNTLKAAEEIPEDKYDFSPAPGVRTVRQLLTHIAFGNEFNRKAQGDRLTTLKGFDFPSFIGGIMAEEQKPRTKAELLALLRTRGDEFAAWLGSLDEAMLAERVEMPQPGESKTRFEMLLGVKEHEMHHRGQLMITQRLIGITPHLTRAMMERMAAQAR